MSSLPFVLFAAGGTGGHLFPAIEIAEELSSQGVECGFAAHGLSVSPFFPHGRWNVWDIQANRPSVCPYKAACFCFQTMYSIKKSYSLLSHLKPSCVIGFGSYHTVPVLAATVLKKTPLFLFEPNVAPGKVIRLFSYFAKGTGIYFDAAKQWLHSPTTLVSMPLLSSNISLVTRASAYERYGFSGAASVVLAFGGSQGASVINQTILSALSLFPENARPHLLLLCGKTADSKLLETMAHERGIVAKILPFEEEMAYAYAAADVVVCRSGASTIAELELIQKPAICIPYPHAKEDHQRKNAEMLAKKGNVIVLDEMTLTYETLSRELKCLLQQRRCAEKTPIEPIVRESFSKIVGTWLKEGIA